MTLEQDQFASIIVDQAVAAASVPWPCPCEIGPDGRYRLEELIAIGRGSFVYRATDRLLSSQGFDATVAVKIVRRREGGQAEALPARRVEHPNIARVLDRGRLDRDHDFTVLEFVQGGTLAEVEPRWPPARAAAFMVQVARGIQAAHSAGVTHLDLKPSNILLTQDQTPKVTDFGLARLEHEEEGPARGTRAFMSPEQGRHEPNALTPPSDIYALGGLLYYLIRGEPPNGLDAREIVRRHAQNALPPPLRVSRDLDRICARALAPSPADRYPSAAQFADDLERWLSNRPLDWTHPAPWRRLRLWTRREPASAAALFVLIVLAAGAVVFWRLEETRRFQQQLLVLEEAHKEIERTRGLGRLAIEQLAGVVYSSNGENIANSLVWLNLLYEFMLIEDNAWLDATMLTEPMQEVIDRLEATGQERSIEALLAYSTVAYWKVRDRDGRGAIEALDLIEARWGEMIPEHDSLRARHRAMRAIAEAIVAVREDSLDDTHAAKLAAARDELRRTTSESALIEMIDYTLNRIRR